MLEIDKTTKNIDTPLSFLLLLTLMLLQLQVACSYLLLPVIFSAPFSTITVTFLYFAQVKIEGVASATESQSGHLFACLFISQDHKIKLLS